MLSMGRMLEAVVTWRCGVVECVACGIAVSDLPYEELGLDVDEAADVLFERIDGQTYCQGCAGVAER